MAVLPTGGTRSQGRAVLRAPRPSFSFDAGGAEEHRPPRAASMPSIREGSNRPPRGIWLSLTGAVQQRSRYRLRPWRIGIHVARLYPPPPPRLTCRLTVCGRRDLEDVRTSSPSLCGGGDHPGAAPTVDPQIRSSGDADDLAGWGGDAPRAHEPTPWLGRVATTIGTHRSR